MFAAGFEGGGGAAFGEVGDEDDSGALGVVDQGLAVGKGLGDVGAAAELTGEEEFDGVVELVAEVDDCGVEEEEADFEGGEFGEDAAHDGAVDDGVGHAAALVDAEDDVPGQAAFDAGEEFDGFD